MLHINDILDPDFDWDEIEITEEEFDELSTELVIDYLKKHGPKERQKMVFPQQSLMQKIIQTEILH